MWPWWTPRFLFKERLGPARVVARALHEGSPRKDRPFVARKLCRFDGFLLGSQLFGHKRGAFTGAIQDHGDF
ncbi:MAG: sigma 54-interacting transcriptional regulator [Nitrospirales bacterium]